MDKIKIYLEKEDLDEVYFSIPAETDLEKKLEIIKEIYGLVNTSNNDKFQLEFGSNCVTNLDDLEGIKNDLDFSDEEVVKIKIFKSSNRESISIYCLKSFEKYLNFFTYEDLLFKLSNLNNNKSVYFQLITDEGTFFTSKYIFSNNPLEKLEALCEKDFILKEKDEFCNIKIKDILKSLPEDFHLKKREDKFEIEEILDKLTLLVSVFLISNSTFLKENTLNYKINGYKIVQNNLNLKDNFLVDKINIVYNIYLWIYKEKNNITERMEISRNIITLYICNDDLLDIDEKVVPSIKSGYEIYLKKNVDRYITVLDNISSIFNNLDNKLFDTRDEFKKKFKGNIVTFFTFFFTTMLFNTISTGTITNIFTKDITILALALLSISVVCAIYSNIEFNKDLEFLEKRYNKHIEHYKAILNQEDIDRIFTTKFNDEIKTMGIIEEKNRCLFCWFITIFIIGLALFLLTDKSMITSLFDNIKFAWAISNV